MEPEQTRHANGNGGTASQLDRARAEHGDVVEVDTAAGPAIFRKLRRNESKRYGALIAESKVVEAAEYVCAATVVYPSREQWAAMVEDKPLIVMAALNHVTELSGGGQAEAKK